VAVAFPAGALATSLSSMLPSPGVLDGGEGEGFEKVRFLFDDGVGTGTAVWCRRRPDEASLLFMVRNFWQMWRMSGSLV
jgi:hypothetical protein